MRPAPCLTMMREAFIREMTRLAITHKAINLSQGFPDFDPPREVIEAAHRARLYDHMCPSAASGSGRGGAQSARRLLCAASA
jgi:aspartate/methionine/tyrosine aminotransferase